MKKVLIFLKIIGLLTNKLKKNSKIEMLDYEKILTKPISIYNYNNDYDN